MLVKGFIVSMLPEDETKYYITIPTYDGYDKATEYTEIESRIATVKITPGCIPYYTHGDVVFIEFENDNLELPVILGKLYREEDNSESTSNLDINSITVGVNTSLPNIVHLDNEINIDLSTLSGTSTNIEKRFDLIEQQLQNIDTTDIYDTEVLLSDDTISELGLTAGDTVQTALEALHSETQELKNQEKIGDIKSTVRTNLGTSWLLCNGAQIDSDDYPELSSWLGISDYSFNNIQNIGTAFYPLASAVSASDVVVVVGRTRTTTAGLLAVATSTDHGSTWALQTIGETTGDIYQDILWDGTQFVIFTIADCGSIWTSTDGISWTLKTTGVYGSIPVGSSPVSIAFDGITYMVSFIRNSNSYPRIAYSTNLTSWTPVTLSSSATYYPLVLKYHAGTWYLFGNDSSYITYLWWSTNKTSWSAERLKNSSSVNISSAASIEDVLINEDYIVVLGNYYSSGFKGLSYFYKDLSNTSLAPNVGYTFVSPTTTNANSEFSGAIQFDDGSIIVLDRYSSTVMQVLKLAYVGDPNGWTSYQGDASSPVGFASSGRCLVQDSTGKIVGVGKNTDTYSSNTYSVNIASQSTLPTISYTGAYAYIKALED